MPPKQENWRAIARNPKLRTLHRKKMFFLFGWWLFSMVYYLLLPIGAGTVPGFFGVRVIGNVNLGFLFALSQFFVSCALAVYYASWANKVSDRLTEELVSELKLE